MKSDIPAPHLKQYIPPYNRLVLVRLRLSSLPLQVELGKRTKTIRHERFCLVHSIYKDARPDFHHDCVEDIHHFLLECPAYAVIRSHPRFVSLFNNTAHGTSISARLRAIFQHRDQALLAEYVAAMWDLRKIILQTNDVLSTNAQFLPPLDFQFDYWWLLGHLDNGVDMF